MDDLKPCPFCGNDMADMGNADDEHYFASSNDKPAWAVECSECKAIGPFCPSTNGAIAEWNTRTPDLAAEVLRLRDALAVFADTKSYLTNGPCDPDSPKFSALKIARAALKGTTE